MQEYIMKLSLIINLVKLGKFCKIPERNKYGKNFE